jgi:hypothetical protein
VLVSALACWRLSNMLVNEAGPFEAFASLRRATGIIVDDIDGSSLGGPSWNPLTCLYCTSIYMAVLSYFMPNWLKNILAISAIASLIGRAHDG